MAVEPSGVREGLRVEGLVSAQEKAIALFAEVEARALVAPGVSACGAGGR
ncbi:hypothetical protein [Kitasatospora sp. NPDC050463]